MAIPVKPAAKLWYGMKSGETCGPSANLAAAGAEEIRSGESAAAEMKATQAAKYDRSETICKYT